MIDLKKFEADAPTPGQSLTTEPGNRPWETPAQLTEPADVLDFYAGKILQPEQSARLMEVLETGIPVNDIVDAITLGGVMQGVHSIDLAVLVSKNLYNIIVALADKLDVEYTEGSDGAPFADDLIMSGVRKMSKEQSNALETEEKEKIETYVTGLMSKPSVTPEEEEE
tara:strand:- start:85 stop:588 length:504 start_codon:yes stop_codon:yes gene_type:complete